VGELDCRKEAAKAFQKLKGIAEKAESEAAKIHGCDQRGRDYGVAETLALDVEFDPKTPGYSSGESLWNRLSRLAGREGACYRFGKYAAAFKRHIAVLVQKLPAQPGPGAPYSEYEAWHAQRNARQEAARIAASIVDEYQRKGCWAAAVAGADGRCVPAFDAASLARARASGNADEIVAGFEDALRLGAPADLLRKEIASATGP
jgi:hypothetical protein